MRAITTGAGTISLGHTEASSAQCRAAVDQGATVFTHLFNAMRSLHHRQPGPVDAALAGNAYVELICDGIHVAPDIVNLVYRVKGTDRIILITDAMHATGCGDGTYQFVAMTSWCERALRVIQTARWPHRPSLNWRR